MKSLLLAVSMLIFIQNSWAEDLRISENCRKVTEDYLHRFKMGKYSRQAAGTTKKEFPKQGQEKESSFKRVDFFNQNGTVTVMNDLVEGYEIEYCTPQEIARNHTVLRCSKAKFGTSDCGIAKDFEFIQIDQGKRNRARANKRICMAKTKEWPCRDYLELEGKFMKMAQGPEAPSRSQGSVSKPK